MASIIACYEDMMRVINSSAAKALRGNGASGRQMAGGGGGGRGAKGETRGRERERKGGKGRERER